MLLNYIVKLSHSYRVFSYWEEYAGYEKGMSSCVDWEKWNIKSFTEIYLC